MARYASRVAPALAAGLIGLGHLPDPPLAAALALGTLIASSGFARATLPLQLLPIARLVVTLCSPLLAAAAVLGLAAYAGHEVAAGTLVVPVVSSWLVSALGIWAQARFESESPVRIAVIGTPNVASALSRELEAAEIVSHRVVATIDPTAAQGADPGAAGHACADSGSELDRVIGAGSVDLVADATGDAELEICEQAAAACLRHGACLIDAGQLYEQLFGRVPVGTIGSTWFRYLIHPSFRPGGGVSKRAFDLAFGSLLGVLLAPLLALAAILIRLESPGPAIYRQPRVGERGREFSILKLRTMRADADHAGERWSERDDERVTRVGRWLRASHLDELPQLWNVLRGEMTFVGPRPEQPGMVASLERRLPYYERRHLVRPGISGWAQVRCGYAGSETGTAWKLCHDLYYLKRRSLYTDCLVLIETLRAVGNGAQYGREAPDPLFIFGQAPAG